MLIRRVAAVEGEEMISDDPEDEAFYLKPGRASHQICETCYLVLKPVIEQILCLVCHCLSALKRSASVEVNYVSLAFVNTPCDSLLAMSCSDPSLSITDNIVWQALTFGVTKRGAHLYRRVVGVGRQ